LDNHAKLKSLLEHLIAEWESEVVEFKRAGSDYNTDRIGQYFSALSNEANLRSADSAWLVFGIDNNTRSVCGTDYRLDRERLHSLKHQINQGTDPSVTFRNIHELILPEGRVLLFEVPAAPCGLPIAWKGHWYARAGESLVSLAVDKLDAIRAQTVDTDWSAQVVEAANTRHLDESAVAQARKSFAEKHANRFSAEDVAQWSTSVLLDRARLTRDGNLTRAALLLLGKPGAAHLLSPHPAQMTWKLEGPERAYEHFGPPFLLNTTALYRKIRNVQLRVLPDGSLLPVEVAKYDQKIVLEALHNCIAHQDYNRDGRVVVTEHPERLVFESEGGFYEGEPTDYIAGERTPRRYRNPFLAQAMVELNMIDSMGYGIHEMYRGQARRYFPLPDYDLSHPGSVKMILYGGIVDPAYSRLLIQKTDLPLMDVLALDRVQKKLPIPDDASARLRRAGLIEGRKPNYFVSSAVASATARKADYIRTRGLDDRYYAKLLTDYLEKFGQASRAEINKFLMDKLSDALNEKQKYNKVSNLLTKLRRNGLIVNTGSDAVPCWRLAES
jgi:ATP-dependent DNA helicase RecG